MAQTQVLFGLVQPKSRNRKRLDNSQDTETTDEDQSQFRTQSHLQSPKEADWYNQQDDISNYRDSYKSIS